MSRIADNFAKYQPALIPFLTGGSPSLAVTRDAIIALSRAGAAVIEIGFPFTDPIADGPVIAQSMHQALQRGVTPKALFELVHETRPTIDAAIVAMVTDSIVTRMGPEHFVASAASAGFDGMIVPDIDLEAAVPLAGLARSHDIGFTLLVAPTTSAERMSTIVSLCSGFVYVLARVGVTGERAELDEESLRARVEHLRRCTNLPLAVGFGVSNADQVRRIGKFADGVIVGSALVRRMEEAGEAGAAAAADAFVRELIS